MLIQCGIFINALRFQKLFLRFFRFLFCWSFAEIFHFPSHNKYCSPWSKLSPKVNKSRMILTSSGWLCWIFLPKPKPTKESAKMGLEAIKGANIPAKQNYLVVWCIVIWYHLKAQMPKELEALHLTSNYEDEDDYQKETMMIIRRERWLLWEKNGDDHEKRRIMRRGRWWL